MGSRVLASLASFMHATSLGVEIELKLHGVRA